MMDLIQWFIAPLQHEFMLKAILVSALVGVVCSRSEERRVGKEC